MPVTAGLFKPFLLYWSFAIAMGPFRINFQAGHLPYQPHWNQARYLCALQSSILPRELAEREQEDDGKEKKREKLLYVLWEARRTGETETSGWVCFYFCFTFLFLHLLYISKAACFFCFLSTKGYKVVGIIDIGQDAWRAETHNTIQSILGYYQCLYTCSRPTPSLIDTLKDASLTLTTKKKLYANQKENLMPPLLMLLLIACQRRSWHDKRSVRILSRPLDSPSRTDTYVETGRDAIVIQSSPGTRTMMTGVTKRPIRIQRPRTSRFDPFHWW